MMLKLNQLKELHVPSNDDAVDDDALDNRSQACSNLEKLNVSLQELPTVAWGIWFDFFDWSSWI